MAGRRLAPPTPPVDGVSCPDWLLVFRSGPSAGRRCSFVALDGGAVATPSTPARPWISVGCVGVLDRYPVARSGLRQGWARRVLLCL